MSEATRPEHAIGAGLLLGGSIVCAALIPVFPSTAPPFALGGLIALGAVAIAGLAAAGVAAWHASDAELPARLEAAWMWGAAIMLLLCAVAAVAATAESLDLRNIVLAQANTTLYVAGQPAAAALFLVAIALAGSNAALDPVLGPAHRGRGAILLVVAVVLSVLGATLFLGGYAGDRLPPVAWLILRSAVVFLAILFLRERLRRITPASRHRIAWGCAIVGVVNLAIVMIRAMP